MPSSNANFLVFSFITFVLGEKMLKDTFTNRLKAVTNHSINGNTPETNRSINGKIQPQVNASVQQVDVGHGQQAVFLFKTFGKIGWAGEPRFECYLRNTVMLFFHQVFCFFKPEIF